MKTLILSLAFLFSFSVISAQKLQPPVTCSTCNYGFKLLGTKFLVKKNRNFYGSEKRTSRNPKAEFSATPTSTDRQLLLGDVYPAMGGYALFYNWDTEGTAHLTELDSSVVVFKRNGSTYAWACENLLEIAAYSTVRAVSEPPAPKPEPIIARDTIWKKPVVMEPTMVTLQVCFGVYGRYGHLVRTDFAKAGEFEYSYVTVPLSEFGIGKKYLPAAPEWNPCGCEGSLFFYQPM